MRKMISAQLRDANLVVNLAALRHNLKTQIAKLPAGSRILPVVKANAYGNGLVPVVNSLKDEPGVAGFCVAILDEGLRLRDEGISKMVLVLGITPVQYALVAVREGVSLTVGSLAWLQEYIQMATVAKITKPLRVHLGLDTGMGRIKRNLLKRLNYWKRTRILSLKESLLTFQRLIVLMKVILTSNMLIGNGLRVLLSTCHHLCTWLTQRQRYGTKVR